jgi:hypothetical protein
MISAVVYMPPDRKVGHWEHRRLPTMTPVGTGGMQRTKPLQRRTPLRARGTSETSVVKERIQNLVRQIVVARDGGCILRGSFEVPPCGGYANDGHLVLQADHLVTRANSATYADTRLIVCVCKAHHGWKSVGGNRRKELYDAAVRAILPTDRAELWDRAETDSWRPTRVSATDWKIEEAALKQELAAL